MKKINFFLISLLALLTGLTKANAEVTYPYIMDFNTAIDVSTETFVPGDGWSHSTDGASKNMAGDLYYPTYTYNTTGGVENSGYLAAGTQTLYDKAYKEDYVCKDMIVSPAVKGKVTVYAKATATTDSYIHFYEMGKNKWGNWSPVKSTPIVAKEASDLGDGWVKIEVGTFDADTYIGICASNMGIDNFEVVEDDTPAPVARIGFASVDYRLAKPVVDDDNNYTINVNVRINNDGKVDILASNKNFTVTLYNLETKEDVATVPFGADIPVGNDKTVVVPFKLSYSQYPDPAKYGIRENISQTTYEMPYTTITPRLNVAVLSAGIAVSKSIIYELQNNATIEFGNIAKPDQVFIGIKSAGPKDLAVSEIITEGDVSVSDKIEYPITLPEDQGDSLAVTINVNSLGEKSGKVTIKSNGGDYVLNFKGNAVDLASTWYEDFEASSSLPAGWTKDGTSGVSSYLSSYKTPNNKRCIYLNGYSADQSVITPLLKVEEGEKLSFIAAHASIYNNERTKDLRIYYSADGEEWTLAKTIAPEDLGGDKFSSYFLMKSYTIDNIPAGQYYVKFTSRGAYIDNISGYHIIAPNHDIEIQSTSIPATGMVNEPVTASITLNNKNLKPEAAGTYTATLYVDDEAVGTVDDITLPAGVATALPISFTPHAAGDIEAYITFTSYDGEVSLKSEASTITINPEVAIKDIASGTAASLGTAAPLNLSKKQSSGIVLYPASKLAGLKNGDKITKIVFKGFGPKAAFESGFSTKLSVYISNSSDETLRDPQNGYSSSVYYGMTKIYDGDYSWPITASSTSESASLSTTAPLLTLTLDEPFVYTGKSIKMVLVSIGTSTKNIQFELDDDADAKSYVTAGTDIEDFDWDDGPFYDKKASPVAHFFTNSTPVDVKGTLTDKSGNAIAGADVTLKSGDVEYYGTSDDEGNYTVKVFKDDLKYEATAEAYGYDDTTADVDVTSDANNMVLTLSDCFFAADEAEPIVLPIALNAETAAQFGKFYSLTSYAEGTATFNLIQSVDAYTPYIFVPAKDVRLSDFAALIAEEPKSFDTMLDATKLIEVTKDGLTFAGVLNREHIGTTADNSFYGYTGESSFLQIPADDYYSTPLEAVLKGAASTPSVINIVLSDVVTGINGIGADKADTGKIYTLDGIEVGKNATKLQRGVYIKNGKKVVVK